MVNTKKRFLRAQRYNIFGSKPRLMKKNSIFVAKMKQNQVLTLFKQQQ